MTRQKKAGQDHRKTKIASIQIRIFGATKTEPTKSSFNNFQIKLNTIKNTPLQTKNTIRFLHYFGKSMKPKIIKANGITKKIHWNEKFFLGMNMMSKGKHTGARQD